MIMYFNSICSEFQICKYLSEFIFLTGDVIYLNIHVLYMCHSVLYVFYEIVMFGNAFVFIFSLVINVVQVRRIVFHEIVPKPKTIVKLK